MNLKLNHHPTNAHFEFLQELLHHVPLELLENGTRRASEESDASCRSTSVLVVTDNLENIAQVHLSWAFIAAHYNTHLMKKS